MRLFRNPELKGILALAGVALVLAAVFLALTGKLTDWFGIRLTLTKPLTDAIVFVSDRNGHPDIWVMKPDGSGQRALTNDRYVDSDPVLSPDGYTIVFVSKRDSLHNQLYALDADGTHLRRLTDMTGTKSAPRFTSDGKEIIFLCAGDVWRAGARGDRPERVLPTSAQVATSRSAEERSPYVWAGQSPGGKLLAAIQSFDDSQLALWMKPGDEAPQPIVDETQQGRVPLAGEMVQAAWAPGSERLALTLTDREGTGALAIADLESESVVPAPLRAAMGSPDWSPDGSTVVVEVLKRTGPGDYRCLGLLLVDLSGSRQPRPLVRGEARGPRWSGDGKRILYTLGRDICSVDVESGQTINLTEGSGSNSDPTWAPQAK